MRNQQADRKEMERQALRTVKEMEAAEERLKKPNVSTAWHRYWRYKID